MTTRRKKLPDPGFVYEAVRDECAVARRELETACLEVRRFVFESVQRGTLHSSTERLEGMLQEALRALHSYRARRDALVAVENYAEAVRP